MSQGKGWDLTSRHSLEGAAEWIRKGSGGLLVLVMPEAMRRLEDVRLEAKARAKVKRFQGGTG